MTLRPAILGILGLAAGGVQAADGAFEGAGLQALAGLAAVLATIVAAAWLLRRFTSVGGPGGGPLKTIAVLAVGPKERVMLVECSDTWILVGVAAGRVSALHCMPKPEAPASGGMPTAKTPAPGPGFRRWLDKALAERAR